MTYFNRIKVETKIKRLNIILPREKHMQLKLIATKIGTNMSDLITKKVDEIIKEQDKLGYKGCEK